MPRARPLLSLLSCVLVCGTVPAATSARTPSPIPAGGPHRAILVATPGTNLLRNPGAQAGAASLDGWDAVTIPGWRVSSGLPTVVREGTRGFPPARGGATRRNQIFVGGAGGTAQLLQWVSLRRPGGGLLGGVGFRLSARLGAGASSVASVSVRLEDARGRTLAVRRLAPVSGRDRHAVRAMRRRALTGRLPRGTVRARVTIRLATSLTNVDGEYAPQVGYDRAVADDIRFSLGAAVDAPPGLRAPVARVPRYRHVFLFYFENQDVGDIVGNRRQAPYYNRLLAQGSELDQMYAEEHPSDGNYLAFAGGSTFGIPLDDPAEENSQYTIHAANIGDSVDRAGETWKAYEQSAAGPCDDTVHGYYWDDDLPMMYFADVRDRPAYCAAHVVPLQSLRADLAHASTTPNFAWVGVNDCDDMEGCGIRAGDRFLARELGEIMRSPAWRTQRSLAIITFDEDAVDHERPAQRIPTIILGSRGVRRGYTSRRRYTHYSLLRTVEAALGLDSLTANDRDAQPLNDIFRRGAPGAVAPRSPYARPRDDSIAVGNPQPMNRARPEPRATSPGATAFVVNSTSATVTPITLATHRTGAPIPVGRDPLAIALTPDDRTAYVVDAGSDAVTPIDTATRRARRAIRVGRDPQAIAITPDGRTAYVTDAGSGEVTPIDLRTDHALAPIAVGAEPHALVITPNGATVLVCDWGSGQVTPIATASRSAGPPVAVGAYPSAIVTARDERRAYVADYGSDAVTPLTVGSDRPGPPVRVGSAPDALALTPDGRTAEVVSGDTDAVTPLATGPGRAGRAIPVGSSPTAIALSHSGRTAFVVNTISGTVTPIDIARRRAGEPIRVGLYSYPTQITLAPRGPTAVVVGTYAGTVRLLDTRTRSVSRAIRVGGYPVAVAITR